VHQLQSAYAEHATLTAQLYTDNHIYCVHCKLLLLLLYASLQIVVLMFSLGSGLMSLYFFANRITGVSSVSSTRQGLEWCTMIFWMFACMLMAYKTSRKGASLAVASPPRNRSPVTAASSNELAANSTTAATATTAAAGANGASDSSAGVDSGIVMTPTSGSYKGDSFNNSGLKSSNGTVTPKTPPLSQGGSGELEVAHVQAVTVEVSEEDILLAAAAARRKTGASHRSRSPMRRSPMRSAATSATHTPDAAARSSGAVHSSSSNGNGNANGVGRGELHHLESGTSSSLNGRYAQ
jgi:hypothetical protein